jgi:polyether ionophore transport system ATP-binding protein
LEQVFRECVVEAKGRKQTVLLSSHILSEVEVVCDRVAILRAGRLVETGTLTELRHLAALSVEATLRGPVPDLSGIPGVSHLRVDGHRLQCQVFGPVEPLLAALAGAGVEKLLSREPSLEELFLAHYGAVESSPVGVSA